VFARAEEAAVVLGVDHGVGTGLIPGLGEHLLHDVALKRLNVGRVLVGRDEVKRHCDDPYRQSPLIAYRRVCRAMSEAYGCWR
jgi:hypothetical protein